MSAATKTQNKIIGGKGKLRGGQPGNSGGKKGRSGRKPEEFRAWCRDLVEAKPHQAAINAILKDPDHTHFAKLTALLCAYGYGQPTAHIEVTETKRYVVRMPQVPESTEAWLERFQPMSPN